MDIDLHIIDPLGNEFYYDRRKFTGVPGELIYDLQYGPGVEVWEADNPLPGTYTVYYKAYSFKGRNKNSANIVGKLRSGSNKLIVKRQNRLREGEKRMVAKFKIDNTGSVYPLQGFQ